MCLKMAAIVFAWLLAVTRLASAQSTPQASPVVNLVTDFPIAVNDLTVAKWADTGYVACIGFTNKSTRTIKAVRFKFRFVDAFGDTAFELEGDSMWNLPPGQTLGGFRNRGEFNLWRAGRLGPNDTHDQACWHNPVGEIATSVARVDVLILKVLYADGTIWLNPNPLAPALTQQEDSRL